MLVAAVFGFDGDADDVLAFEAAAEDFLAEGVFDELLDCPTEGTGAEIGVGALVDQEILGFLASISMLHAVLGQAAW